MDYIIAPIFLVLIAKTVLLGKALRPSQPAPSTQAEKEQASTAHHPSQAELDAAARQDARTAEIFQPLWTALSRIESKVDFILTRLEAPTENTSRNSPLSTESSASGQ